MRSHCQRRSFVKGLGGTLFAAATTPVLIADDELPKKSPGLGLATFCRSLLRQQRLDAGQGDLFEPRVFIDYSRELGFGGSQCALGVLNEAAAEALQQQVSAAGMFLEAIISLPIGEEDVARFDLEMQSAAAAGARAARTVLIPGRRYEAYASLEEFRAAEGHGVRMLELATPIAERYQLPLAIENHKDHRLEERIPLFERIDSEYVGACIDTGNSLALLEYPLTTVRALVPWAKSVHLKDQGLQPHADGFLLGDIPLGKGALDLAAIVEVIRAAHPQMPFCLELITRDPLLVPCLRDDYWRPFPPLPATDLARTLRLVQDRTAEALPDISSRSTLAARVDLETQQVLASRDYARATLGL
jgi:sugar phosphate isomerase/epimerase